jgi:hypothetical protein
VFPVEKTSLKISNSVCLPPSGKFFNKLNLIQSKLADELLQSSKAASNSSKMKESASQQNRNTLE